MNFCPLIPSSWVSCVDGVFSKQLASVPRKPEISSQRPKNKLEFEAISKALQTLWDEQLLGQRYPSSMASANHGHLYWQSWEASHDYDWWAEAQWHDEHYGDDWNWEDDHAGHDPSTLASVDEEDDQLKEAQQAEQAAEQLALEAKLTWVEARGFGQISTAAVKCFNCGGSHFARDCPDKRVFPYKGGKGKNNHMMDYDDPQLYYMNGGKGKGKKGFKGKTKSSNLMDYQAMWAGKSKSKGKMSPPVNAYTAYYDLGGMEMQQPLTFSAASAVKETSTTSSSSGMLDCGATASAALDLAVQGLIQTILNKTLELAATSSHTCGRFSGLVMGNVDKPYIVPQSVQKFQGNTVSFLCTPCQTLKILHPKILGSHPYRHGSHWFGWFANDGGFFLGLCH